ncbi:MAG: hypothetical protein VR64_01240 [Desulfatitalea sp. BRH_c12]|nr:MAG: hypothetical protein VR64_01240 [Desulfatitalea sp. BRH_c12]
MKQYVVDELRPADYTKIKAFLDARHAVPGFDGLYWVPVEPSLLNGLQSTHDECQPYYFALDLSPDRLACELLVRTRQHVRCQCIQYATQNQRNWLIEWVDSVLEELEISV